MGRTLSRALALALCLGLLAVGAAGCGGDPARELVGTWRCTADLTDAINGLIQAPDDMAPYFTTQSFLVPLVLELREDGTYRLAPDAAALSRAKDTLREEVRAGALAFARDFIAAEGLDQVSATAEEVLAAMGIDLDGLLDRVFGRLDASALLGDLAAQGTYQAQEGHLCLSATPEAALLPERYIPYILEKGKLTLGVPSGLDAGGLTGSFPQTWTRESD